MGVPMVAAVLAFLVGCGGGTPAPKKTDAGPKATEPMPADPAVAATELPKVVPVFDAKAGDPSVSAEQGGPGFTGEGWKTAAFVYGLGEPTAPQGGSLRTPMLDWPATLRLTGENSNTQVNYAIATMAGESLLGHDPVTNELVPGIASHWQVSEDQSTYRFRIDPRAHYSDGTPITAEDVVATWRLMMSPGLREPSNLLVFGKFEEPKALSRYIVEVVTKERNWRNLDYFGAGMIIMPAKELGTLTDKSPDWQASGEAYLNKYQFAYPVMSGAYLVKPEDIKTGESVTLTRNRSWWREADPVMDGWYNLERITFVTVKDSQLAFEKVKKGELDYYVVAKAQWWAEDIPAMDDVKRGLLAPRKFYTAVPVGTSGLALNTERPPLDDDNVRLALQHLYDRETFIDKLFFHEYEPITSYFQGSTYSNPDNKPFAYDEVTAVELLEKSGWTEKNADGFRVKDGKELKFTVSYRGQLSERYLTLYQESCKRAGIRLELQLLNDSTAWKNITERAYEIQEMAWGALVVPNPETTWASSLADQKDNNNVTAFRNARVDELLKAYDAETEPAKRVAIIREIDGIVYQQHPYVLGWFSPAQRILYTNKYGMPRWGSPRLAWGLGTTSLFALWWEDPAKVKAIEQAHTDPAVTIDAPPREEYFWRQWAAAHPMGEAGSSQ